MTGMLHALHIPCTRRTVYHWLRQGNGLFWNYQNGMATWIGQARVAARLTEHAIKAGRAECVISHKPGGYAQAVDVSGRLADFEARVYAAWIDGKMLANETQERLWNRSRQQLYRWRKKAGIETERNFAQTHHVEDRRIPDNCYGTAFTVDGQLTAGVRWQRPNTYHAAEPSRQHAHRGQGYKVRRAVNAVLDLFQEALVSCVESYPARSQYWHDPRALKRSLKRFLRGDWHTDYCYRKSSRGGYSIWELMPPDQWQPVTGLRIAE